MSRYIEIYIYLLYASCDKHFHILLTRKYSVFCATINFLAFNFIVQSPPTTRHPSG